MKVTTGLMIPIYLLESASGIQKSIIKKDIGDSLLRVNENGLIWYHDAFVYVVKKWNEGKIDMYPPYSDEPSNSFAARVLSMIDDEISSNNVIIEWKKQS